MQASTTAIPETKKTPWAGIILSALPVLFLLFDGVTKLMKIAPVTEAFARLGYPTGVAMGIGILQIFCVIVYIVPRTSVLGAILLTGYLGGAVASHVRIGDPFWFPILFGALLWGGLFLRDERLRTLVPLRR